VGASASPEEVTSVAAVWQRAFSYQRRLIWMAGEIGKVVT
jgi:hypothetical protein